MSVVADLETGLQAMLNLKPPGVSGSRIGSITTLCVNNVQSESVLIQKIYTHFKKTPGTHKLGVLYVVDSVTRKWLEQAKAQGQPINGSAQDGTFAAGVHRVTELMPVLMNDILSTAPEDQKEKIKKLVDIWEKGQTFPPSMLESFKQRLSAPLPPKTSTTPPGSPPANLAASMGAATKPDIPNIMQTLANLARQNNAGTAASSNPGATAPPVSAAYGVGAAQAGHPLLQALQNNAAPSLVGPSQQQHQPHQQQQQQQQQHALFQQLQQAPPVNLAPGLPFQLPPGLLQQPPLSQGPSAINPLNGASMQANGFASGQPIPAAAPPPPTAESNIQQQLLLIQTLAAQGVPVETITSIVAQLAASNTASAVPAAPQPLAAPIPPLIGGYPHAGIPGPADQPPPAALGGRWDAGQGRPGDVSHDATRDGYLHDPLRSPNRARGGRSRSRSPGRRWGGDNNNNSSNNGGYDYARNSPPGRRGLPGGGFDEHDRERDRDRDRGGRGGRDQAYRQRSPPGAGRRGGSPAEERPPVQGEKWVEYDSSLPNGHIKVLSRTLFVGGVTCSEAELRSIFARHGQVQTCIVNKEKRHAFVKMYFRKDAVIAKEAMEEARNHDLPLRTRWGVGFGPRDCSDYATGVSVIPISKLTEADRKWMLTAEFGGSGGRPIASGLSVEEPDIEIGAGVSSKAISRRMQTDKGGSNGPKSSRGRDGDEASPLGGGGGGGPPAAAAAGATAGGGGGGGGGGGAADRGGGGGGGRWRRGRENNRDGGAGAGAGGREDGGRRRPDFGGGEQHRGAGGGGGDANKSGVGRANGGDKPVVPDFPFGLSIGPNGMPIFPPGFSFPPPEGGQGQGQGQR